MTSRRLKGAAALLIAVALTASSASAQTIQEFFAPPSSPYDITVGSDGAMWFTSLNLTIFRLQLNGTFTEFSVPGAPSQIARGPDGALWITDVANSWLVRLTTTGAVTTFPLNGARALHITSGPDGALWFSESGLSRIGRMTIGGGLTEFPVPSGVQPGPILVGPDGAIWFGGIAPPSLGRLTLSGQFSEFPIPTRAVDLALGADGAFWMTTERNSIGRMTLTGQFSEFSIPTPSSAPIGITPGPDGALWFTELAGNKIGRITISGAISEIPVPTAGAEPLGIVLGPDGNLWFTEWFARRIGRVILAPNIVGAGPLPAGFVSEEYAAGLSATSGITPYVWSVAAGTLPPGLVLGSNGLLTGIPRQAGFFTFTVEVRDTAGGVGRATFSLGILNPQAIPTLSVWAILLLAILLGGAGLVALRH